jgi:hypothetical protein
MMASRWLGPLAFRMAIGLVGLGVLGGLFLELSASRTLLLETPITDFRDSWTPDTAPAEILAPATSLASAVIDHRWS